MKRRLPIIFFVVGGLLLLPIIGLHVMAMWPGRATLAVVAPSVALATYALAAAGLLLIVAGLAGLVLARKRPLP